MSKPIPKNQKEQMRHKVLALRDVLDVGERIEKSIAACEIGTKSIQFQPDDIISGFWPIRSEIDPRPLIANIQQTGARLCLPVVLDRETIEFRQLVRGEPLVKAGFGTVGPGADAEILEPTIMLIPLAAFDHHGGRLGYGAGHYDRAIEKLVAKNQRPRLIGIAFDIQKVDRVPTEPHDQKLDMIITETGTINVS